MDDFIRPIKRELEGVSDEELLLELRVRGLLGRVEGSATVPAHVLKDGYQISELVRHSVEAMGFELIKLIMAGQKIPGCKQENVPLNTGAPLRSFMPEGGLKYTTVVNYVCKPVGGIK